MRLSTFLKNVSIESTCHSSTNELQIHESNTSTIIITFSS